MARGEYFFEEGRRKVRFNSEGLSEFEQKELKDLAVAVFKGAVELSPSALERCTFFAEPGYKVLMKLIEKSSLFVRAAIRGDDTNPFQQHYWLECDLMREDKLTGEVVIDPIFGYVGLKSRAGNFLGDDRFYRRGRNVKPNTPAWEGGVRINTMGI